MMKLLLNLSISTIFVLFLTQIADSQDVQPLDCEAEFVIAEKCFADLMISAEKVPWTKESAKVACDMKFESIDCIDNYRKKCITGMANMVFSMIGKKFRSTFNYVCNNQTALDGKYSRVGFICLFFNSRFSFQNFCFISIV